MADRRDEDPNENALKKSHWDDEEHPNQANNSTNETGQGTSMASDSAAPRWSSATPRQYVGGETPRMATGDQRSAWKGLATPTATPYAVNTPQFGAGGQTPLAMGTPGQSQGGVTPTYSRFGGTTPLMGQTPMVGQTPNYQFEGTTPLQSNFAEGETRQLDRIEKLARKLEKEWLQKNKRLTEEYLDSILPAEDFEIFPMPLEYQPQPPQEINFFEEAAKALSTLDLSEREGAGETNDQTTYDIPDSLGPGMPPMKPQDAEAFVELLKFHNIDPIPDEYLPSYLLTKNLFKIKNGDNNQKRIATRYLLDKSPVFTPRLIFERLFRIWSKDVLNIQEQHYYVEFIKALIAHAGVNVTSSAKEIVHMMQPLLSTKMEQIIREDGKQVLMLLTRVVGFKSVFEAIKPDFVSGEKVIRRHAALVTAICGYAVGGEELMAALKEMSLSSHSSARQTVALALAEMAPLFGHGVVALLPDIVPLLENFLQDDKKIRLDAARAVSGVAEASAPYGIEELEPLVGMICEECKRGLGAGSRYFLQAFGSLVPLMSPGDAQRYTAAMMPVLVSQFSRPEDEFRRVMLTVVRKCIASEGVTAPFIRDVILRSFFEGFWGIRHLAADRRAGASLVSTTVQIAKKVGGDDVLRQLAPDMKDEMEAYQRMVINTVRTVVENEGLDTTPDSLVDSLLDGAMSALRKDESGEDTGIRDCLAVLCNALGPRLKGQRQISVYELISRRRDEKNPAKRTQAVLLASLIAQTTIDAGGTSMLAELGRSIYERMEDDDPHVIAANVKASHAFLSVLGAEKYKPSVRELLKRLTFVIKNKHNVVQQNCISLIELIVNKCPNDVDPVNLLELATKDLFQLLDAERRQTRQACTRVFGAIAEAIRPFAIILELVENFRQDKRKIRICTAVALGSIAKACGPFTVLPYILNEYKLSQGEQVAIIVQHSVLKAIRYIFEAIGSVGKEYVYPLVPLLERALTESSIQMRRMATEACRSIMLAIAGNDGFEELAIHFLNYIHPNIVELLSRKEVRIAEERLKMVTAVVGYYEAIRTVLSPGQILLYLLQGLFHPASKVRDIYRRTYNMVYLISPQSLLPYYPRVEDDKEHTFTRHELEVFV